jgi:regulator of sigma E protease
MFHLPSFVTQAVAFLFSIGVLIVMHEWGHYIMAKRGGVPVEEFSIGFGPILCCMGHRGETTFNLRAIPVGGYVRMTGMEPGDDADGGYNTKPVWTRVKIICAGVAINLAVGFLIVVLLGITVGLPREDMARISAGDVTRGSAAEQAGLRKGDVILSVDGTPATDPFKVTTLIRSHAGKKLAISVQRAGTPLALTAIPKAELDGGKMVGRLGFAVITDRVWERRSLASSLVLGVENTWQTVAGIVHLIRSGAILARGQVGGPIAIAQMAGAEAERGAKDLLLFIATLSINLGVLNILPIPALDGGHMLLLGVESIRRRKLAARTAMVVQVVGFAFLVSFICYVSFWDILRTWHKG